PLFRHPPTNSLPYTTLFRSHEPCNPILCSIDTHRTWLRSPSDPSFLTRNFGTTNVDSPFTPGGESGSRARTKWMMLSTIPCSPEDRKSTRLNSSHQIISYAV